MSSSPVEFFPRPDASDATVSVEVCDRHLQQLHLSATDTAHWLCLKGEALIRHKQYLRAITCCNDALRHQPKSEWAIAHRGLAHELLGNYDTALDNYDQALSVLSNKDAQTARSQALWLWNRKGHTYRALRRYPDALNCYDSALAIDPKSADALSGRGTMLALMGKRKEGLKTCEYAVQLAPNSVVILNSLGIVFILMRRPAEALLQFDKALEIQPDFNKTWNNRAIALYRLGREGDALTSLEQAIALSSDTREAWYPSALTFLGFLHLRFGNFPESIESCEQAQSLDPTLFSAAFYKLLSLIASKRILQRLRQPGSRRQLGRDLAIVVNTLKFQLLALALLLGLLIFGQGQILDTVRGIVPTGLSLGIIALIATDLWQNKSKLHFVWQVYFKSGALTYVRAIGILVATLNTFVVAEQFVPPFMLWGWASAVFGNSGNLIFQPFNLLNSLPNVRPEDTFQTLHHISAPLFGNVNPAIHLLMHRAASLPGGIIAHATIPLNFSTAFIASFWLMLLLGIPFWARLEERIFRQGAHTWRNICIRSTQFGLVHLIIGIPILAGFVLIVPGFLFACRYKYVYDRDLKTHRNPLKAQEAGVLASTADHAVYNAILVTIFVATLLF